MFIDSEEEEEEEEEEEDVEEATKAVVCTGVVSANVRCRTAVVGWRLIALRTTTGNSRRRTRQLLALSLDCGTIGAHTSDSSTTYA